MNEMDQQEEADEIRGELTRAELEAKLKEAQERLARYEGYQKLMEETGASQLSIIDADAKLMKNKNVALSRRRLYELVWQEEYTGETRTLDSHVQRLRKKLDWNEKIVTVFRIGYRLEVRG